MIGRGHGSALMRAHADRLLSEGAPAIGTDPHPSNLRAIRGYRRAGFVAGGVRDTRWGPSLLMIRHPDERPGGPFGRA